MWTAEGLADELEVILIAEEPHAPDQARRARQVERISELVLTRYLTLEAAVESMLERRPDELRQLCDVVQEMGADDDVDPAWLMAHIAERQPAIRKRQEGAGA